MATETHIAGLPVEVSGRYLIQRCAWCGAVLIAYDYTMIAMPGTWEKPASFAIDALVRCSYDGVVAAFGGVALARTSKEVLDQTEKLPDDACALNVPLDTMT